MGGGRDMGAAVRRPDQGSRQPVSDARFHPGQGAPAGDDRSGLRPKKGGLGPAVGRSRGGLTTKIHMACDSRGRPVLFLLAPGQSNDILAAPALIAGMTPEAILADRAYDSNALRKEIDRIGARAVIPSTRSRKAPIPHDP